MSMWCEKCNKLNYSQEKCDYCGHIRKNPSKSYKIKKNHKVRILKSKLTRDEAKSNFKNTDLEKKRRGDKYEEYIAKHYRKLGYSVIEHGKEQGVKDGGIDLIAKKENEVVLIQCKDWNENNSHTINHKDIKVLRTDVNDFLDMNPVYKNYDIKLRYTLSGNFLQKSAEKHIETCKENINCEIIKPPYRREELSQEKYIKKPSKKNRTKQNNEIAKMVISILIVIVMLAVLTPISEKYEVVAHKTNKNLIVETAGNQIVNQKEKRKILQREKYLTELQAKKDKYYKEQKLKVDKYRLAQRKRLAEKKAIENRKIYISRTKKLKVQKKKTEREEAKAILMMQMQN